MHNLDNILTNMYAKGHFRDPKPLTFNMMPSAQPFM